MRNRPSRSVLLRSGEYRWNCRSSFRRNHTSNSTPARGFPSSSTSRPVTAAPGHGAIVDRVVEMVGSRAQELLLDPILVVPVGSAQVGVDVVHGDQAGPGQAKDPIRAVLLRSDDAAAVVEERTVVARVVAQ